MDYGTIREAAALWLSDHPDVTNLCGLVAQYLRVECGLEEMQ